MPGIQIDIDLIFESLTGRFLVLLSESGTIIKINLDALDLLNSNNKSEIEGEKWDDFFAPLSEANFTFNDLINASTGYLSIAVSTEKKGDFSLEVKVDSFTLTDGYAGVYYLITARKQHSGNWEDMLFQVMKGTEKDYGEDFIKSVTKSLAKTLKVDYAFVGKLVSGTQDKIETLSFWHKLDYRKNFTYQLAGSPCEDVVNKNQKLIPRNVIQLYPEDRGLVKLGVESYFGTPVYYSNGKPLGILVVMDTEPMENNSSSAYILNIFANRIGAEIEWAETQQSLYAKDRKLKNVMNAIPHPIFYKDKDGKFDGVNKAFIDAVGFTEKEIIGKRELPKTIDGQPNNEDGLLSVKGELTYESSQDGNDSKHYLITKSSVLDEKNQIEGIVGSAMDISMLKQAESELKVNEEKYRTLFSSANDAIFIMNDDIFIDCNEKTLEMFDCAREEIIGQPPYRFSPKIQPDGRESKEKAIEKINDAFAGKAQNFYWKHKTHAGVEFDAEVSLNAFYVDTSLYVQAIVRDVTAKEQMARNIVLQNERMEEMYKFISSSTISFREQISSLLALAAKSLNMEVGIVSKIEGKKYNVIDSYGIADSEKTSIEFDLNSTYCGITYSNNRLVAIAEVGNSEYNKHPAHELFKMESYIGAPYWVKGKKYGTLAFLSKDPVVSYQPIDLDFVQMLAQWVGSTLERMQFEDNLMERDALLETMLREIPIDFSVRKADLEMVIQSDLSKEYWGDNEGKPIDYSDVDEKSAKKWKKIFSRALAGEVVKGEDRVLIYGKPYIFYSIASPVKVKDKVSEVIVINLDISKIKETQQKLEEQNKQLSKLNSELDRFVYSASHDLRAPLASLLGLIDLSSREIKTEPVNHYLELMSKSITTMDRFIADITEYSRNLRLDTVANLIDFNKLFQESFEQIQFMIPGKGDYSISLEGNIPFYSDHERLRMIINNLISNSLRYKAYNRNPFIEFSVKISPKQAVISIADNGIGIGKKHLDRVFDMFYRANDKNVGSGLGLFIVKETVEKLNGNVVIESTLGEGTVVTIKLPNLTPKG